MLGIIPSSKTSYEVYGKIDDDNLIEGKLYYDNNERLYYYSLTEKRSNPKTGFFPIWDGKKFYISKFSNNKYLSDVIKTDIQSMSNRIDKNMANLINYKHQIYDTNIKILQPRINNTDNMFTQCIKGVLFNKKITIIDLFNIAGPKLDKSIIENYYNTLNKISFMRYDKWCVWINDILHLKYKIIIYKSNKKVLEYYYPSNKFDTGLIDYNKAVNKFDDPLTQIVKLLMIMFNIDKSLLRKGCNDDYTVNNLLTSINSNKPLSSQLFSRFISISGFSYTLQLFENDKMIFEFNE